MRIALIENGIVAGVAFVEDGNEYQPPDGFDGVEVDDTVGAGDTYDGKIFTRVADEIPVVTLGQVLDVALQLGTVTFDQVASILPVASKDFMLDKDGSYVVSTDAIDAVVTDHLDRDTKPVDAPPVPDAAVGVADATPALPVVP